MIISVHFAISHLAFTSAIVNQDLIVSNTTRYFEALSGEEKRIVSFHIVDEVGRSGGRFLQRGHRCWIPINRDEARLKVAQAFQYQRRKNNVTQGINQDVSPPPLLRQNHYTPGSHAPRREGVTAAKILGRSETDKTTSINSAYNHNDDILPFVTSLHLKNDSAHISIAAATTAKINEGRSEFTHARLKRRRLRTSPSQQQLNSGAAAMPSHVCDGDSVKESPYVNLNVGKTDPNERKAIGSFQYHIAAHSERVQSTSHTNMEVCDLDDVNKSSSPNDQGGNISLQIQGKAEGMLDGSSVHSIGMSSDDEQHSLVSVLANMNADSWTENEDPVSQFLK